MTTSTLTMDRLRCGPRARRAAWWWLAAVCAGLLLVGCTQEPPAREKVLSPDEQAAAAFFARLPANSDEWLGDEQQRALQALPRRVRALIALRAGAADDPALWPLAAAQFYALGDTVRGDATLARMVTRGKMDQLMAFMWGWMDRAGQTDADFMDQRMLGISRTLLRQYQDLSLDQQQAASRFMCGMDACNMGQVRQELEERQRALASPGPAPAVRTMATENETST